MNSLKTCLKLIKIESTLKMLLENLGMLQNAMDLIYSCKWNINAVNKKAILALVELTDMGGVDIASLHPIYRYLIDLRNENSYPFQFKEDSGDYETMIEFVENTMYPKLPKYSPSHPPISNHWDAMKLINSIPICPDIMDFKNRIVIEFEEESTAGKSSGKLGKKGHWADSKRDSRRDKLYKDCKFRFCKIWESEVAENTWKMKLFHFLADCYCNRDTELYLDMYLREEKLLQAIRKNRK